MKDDPLNRLHVKRGEDLTQTKLSDADVLAIRELKTRQAQFIDWANELTNAKIAEACGVSKSTIDKVTAFDSRTYL